MQIIEAAHDQYLKAHGDKDGVDGGGNMNDALKLFLGDKADVKDEAGAAYGGTKSKEDYKKFLEDSADLINKGDRPMLINAIVHGTSGNMHPSKHKNSNGNVFYGGEHAFMVNHIDVEKGLITYTNPWDSSKKRTIGIDTLANDMTNKGGSALITYADFK